MKQNSIKLGIINLDVQPIIGVKMYTKFSFLPLIFCSLIFIAGCHVLLPGKDLSFLAEQDWSDNYALLEGTLSTNPEMIDGDHTTVGKTRPSTGPGKLYGSSNATEVIVTLPEKKLIRKIVIHSDNIQKFVIYADKGGTLHSDTDWQLVEEIKMVKSDPVVVPYTDITPTARFRIVVLGTSDSAALSRQEKAKVQRERDAFERNPENAGREFRRSRRNDRSYPARISEIEFFGFKSAGDPAADESDSNPEKESKLDLILK